MNQMIRQIAMFSVFALNLAIQPPSVSGQGRRGAVERAEVLLTGKLASLYRVPWFDGWHLFGEIRVTRIVAGRRLASKTLRIHVVCSCCDWKRLVDLDPVVYEFGLWHLRQLPGGNWTSSGECDSIGFLPLSELPGILAELKQFPSTGPSPLY